MMTVVACPQCRQELKLPGELIGRMVQCPDCKHTFTATDTPSASAAAPGAPPPPAEPGAPAEPLRRPPPLPPEVAAEAGITEAPVVDVETEEDEFEKPVEEGDAGADPGPRRPRKRERQRGKSEGGYFGELMKGQRRRMKPHRGPLVLALGIAGLIFAGPGIFAACFAYYMGTDDLNEMYSGRMDSKGEGMTKTGRILGIVGLSLHVAGLAALCACCSLGPILGVGTR